MIFISPLSRSIIGASLPHAYETVLRSLLRISTCSLSLYHTSPRSGNPRVLMGCTLSTVASSTFVPPNDRGHRQFRSPLGSQDADAAVTTAAVRIAFSDTALSGPARLRQPFPRTWAPTTPHISLFTHLSACFEPFHVQPAASTDDARNRAAASSALMSATVVS